MRRVKVRSGRRRKGALLVLAAILMVVVIGMVGFVVDMGYIALVKSELQRSADATALAGAYELLDEGELTGTPNKSATRSSVELQAGIFAEANPAGHVELQMANDPSYSSGDLVIGYVTDPSDPTSFAFNSLLPDNAVRVTLRRDNATNGSINLFFARIFGASSQAVVAESTAIFEGGVKGFKVPPNSNITSKLFPFTLQVDVWNDQIVNGPDDFSHDHDTHSVANATDGIHEVHLFPLSGGAPGNSGVTPGNFGTIDIGSSNNSTADLSRQILYGPNASDMAYFPNNTLELGSNGTVTLNGDTGISAGMKDELVSIIGQDRIIPLYDTVSGNGNNSQFVIVKWVGVTILDVKLTGALSNRHLTVQPAYVVDASAVRGGAEGDASSFVRIPLSLIR